MSAYSQVRLYSIKSIDSLKLIIDGNPEHVFTIGKHKTDTSDVDVILYGGSEISTLFAPIANGVTNGNTHNHVGGDGGTISHTNLSNIGSNSHASIDAHISDNSNPHGSTLTQTTINASTVTASGSIYSTQGNITNTSTTVILDTYEENNGMWLLTFTGEHTDYASTFFGYGAYLIARNRNTYTSSWQTYFLKLFTESYSSRVVVSVSGDDVRLQSSLADATYPLRWRLVRLR